MVTTYLHFFHILVKIFKLLYIPPEKSRFNYKQYCKLFYETTIEEVEIIFTSWNTHAWQVRHSVERFSQLQQILINVGGGGVKYDKEKNVLGFYSCWALDEG